MADFFPKEQVKVVLNLVFFVQEIQLSFYSVEEIVETKSC